MQGLQTMQSVVCSCKNVAGTPKQCSQATAKPNMCVKVDSLRRQGTSSSSTEQAPRPLDTAAATTALISTLWAGSAAAAGTAAEPMLNAAATASVSGYTPSPLEPGWEIWVGFAAGVIPFLIASLEFGKRIVSFCFNVVLPIDSILGAPVKNIAANNSLQSIESLLENSLPLSLI